ncbi:CoA-binding protein [Terrihabitans sp. B22-R8]|uniref:CoA-binding protein n=1 Tax=Terrihabitans sp. B22-R8 TaxID=3425128 RepID=UPI00403CEF71
MSIDGLDDNTVRDILENVRTIAVIGFSQNEDRPSNYVARYLQQQGYRVFPINPGLAGQTMIGEKVYANLSDVPEFVDMVDVFRASEHVGDIVDEAIGRAQMPKVIWTQIGVVNEEAAERARAAGLQVVMDRCPKVEIPRLSPVTPSV